jgi:propanol-preferring alcohol dehydrogenase
MQEAEIAAVPIEAAEVATTDLAEATRVDTPSVKDSMRATRVVARNPFLTTAIATANPFVAMDVAPVAALRAVQPIRIGQRVGVAWIYSACGKCKYCMSGNENLCEDFQATGRDADGGYAQYMKVRAEFAHPIPDSLSDAQAAPLLCAGAVGYRALRLSNLRDGENLGLSGFGASNHLILKMVGHKYPNAKVFVFSRNTGEREFATSLGAVWAGGFDEMPPDKLDAVIDATPVWWPVTEALRHLTPGGRLVINAIRKEEVDKEVLMKLDYPTQLWLEKEIKSVANVTRRDVREFLQLAAAANIQAEVQEYDLKDANQALGELKQGKIRGAKVLRVG